MNLWYPAALLFGRILRGARYSSVRLGDETVEKSRALYAPLLIALSAPLMKALNTGVRVLGKRDWMEHEAAMFRTLYSCRVRTNGRTLVLPLLRGRTLAAILEDQGETRQRQAIGLATESLARLHRRDLTHGDAMAENVMVDLDGGIATWFDFETVHESRRTRSWRRADDLRALLSTCVLRIERGQLSSTVQLIIDTYGDDEITWLLRASFESPAKRALPFHLGQAPLSSESFDGIGRALSARPG